jgi:hypothetical protein
MVKRTNSDLLNLVIKGSKCTVKYHDLVNRHKVSVSQMTTDMFCVS